MAVGLVRSLVSIATGNFTHTKSGLGVTPTLALGQMSKRTNVEAVAASANLTLASATGSGGTDGDTYAWSTEDNQGTTDTGRAAKDTGAGRAWYLGGPGGSQGRDGWGNLGSFSSDAVNWNHADAVNGDNNPFTTLMIGGTDVSVSSQQFNPNATQNSATTVTFGFRPNVIILMSTGLTADGTSTGSTHMIYSVGFVTDDGSTTRQCGVGYWANDSAASEEMNCIAKSDRCLCEITSGPAVKYCLEANNFTATGCDFVTRDGAGDAADDIVAIGLDLSADLTATCGIVDGPTAATSITYTATELPGLTNTPVLLCQLFTLLNAVGSLQTNRTAGGFGYRWATADDEFMHGWAAEDAADPTNSESWSYNKIFINDHDGTAGLEGSLSSFGSAQWTDNYTVRDADVGTVKIPTLVISDDTGGATTGQLINAGLVNRGLINGGLVN